MFKKWEKLGPHVASTIVDSKGRVLLPSRVRKSLNLKAGIRLAIEPVEDGVKLNIPRSDSKQDSMFLDFRNPGRTKRDIATGEFLEGLEQELWGGS